MKINLVMIVKNEERCLRRCLAAAKPLVDEIIVADTGSSDNTAGIAREMGAKVFSFSWINDFSAARNFALKQSDADWSMSGITAGKNWKRNWEAEAGSGLAGLSAMTIILTGKA